MTTTPSPSSVTIREKSVNPARHWLGHQTSLDRYNLISGMASRDSRNYSSFLSGSADIPNSLRLFSGPAKARVQKLFQKFREISRLSKNWNGYNADPIPAAVVVKTATFLRKSSQFWPFFDIFPTAADSIQLELRCINGHEIEIEIGEDDISFCIYDNKGSCLTEDAEIPSPTELVHRLTRAMKGQKLAG